MIKLIIFDWDDVFTLGSKEGYFECYHKAITGVGVKLSPEEERKRILDKWGRSPQRAVIPHLLKERPELVAKAVKIHDKHFFGNTFMKNLTLVKRVIKLLNELAQKYTLSIATGQHPKLFNEKIMPKFHIPNVFSKIIFSCDIKNPEKQKPHPYALQKIMRDLGFKPEETIFVGDAKSDVEMARNTKVTPVVVLTGHLSKKEAEKLGVKYILRDITEIEKFLEKK